MFFMMGITQGRKEIDYNQLVICDHCGSYGRYQVFVTYMVLSLFFIPVFKWGKKYYVQTSCCKATYALDDTVGREIARGESIEIRKEDLTLIQPGIHCYYKNTYEEKVCGNCGYQTDEDFEYCPKCGQHF